MRLENLVASDGYVREYQMQGDIVSMIFLVYGEDEITMEFTGVLKLIERGSIASPLMRICVAKSLERHYARFNDGRNDVLEIEYQECIIKVR